MSGAHALTGQHIRLRRWTLYIFARYVEVPLLAWSYALLRGRHRRWGQNRLVRAILGWLIAAPFAHLVDTARPTPGSAALEVIDGLEGPIAVGPCRCRSAHGACDHPLDTDIVIHTGVEAWTRAFPQDYRPISKEEAKHILAECGELGMWHMVFTHCPVNQGHEYVICNCCTCGCVPYVLNRELGQRAYPLRRGASVAHTDPTRCAGHGACVAACPFDARALVQRRAQLVGTCFGCGRCVDACPEQAIAMRNREP
jgi:ferredoxin